MRLFINQLTKIHNTPKSLQKIKNHKTKVENIEYKADTRSLTQHITHDDDDTAGLPLNKQKSYHVIQTE